MDLGKYGYLITLAGFCLVVCGLATSGSDHNNSNVTIVKEIVEVPVNNTTVVESTPSNHNDTSENSVEDNSTYYSDNGDIQTYENNTPSLEDQMLTREREKYEVEVNNGSKDTEQDNNVDQTVNTYTDNSDIEQNYSSPVANETIIPDVQILQQTEKHKLSTGYLSYKAPLTYYNVKAGKDGTLNMGADNEGKEFVLIPV